MHSAEAQMQGLAVLGIVHPVQVMEYTNNK